MATSQDGRGDESRVGESYGALTIVAVGFAIAMIVAASTLPLLQLARMVDAVAGEKTELNAELSVTLTVSVAFSLTGLAVWRKLRAQKKELIRQRGVIEDLEQELDDCRGELDEVKGGGPSE